MKYIISHGKTKRILEDPFEIEGALEDLKFLAKALTDLAEDAVSHGIEAKHCRFRIDKNISSPGIKLEPQPWDDLPRIYPIPAPDGNKNPTGIKPGDMVQHRYINLTIQQRRSTASAIMKRCFNEKVHRRTESRTGFIGGRFLLVSSPVGPL